MSYFIIPIEVVARSGASDPVRQEKYVPALGVQRQIVDHGETAIVWADCTPAQEAAIAANADVLLVPPLDNLIGAGALVAVRAAIEALDIPAQWVQAGMTYRTALRVIVGMAQLLQRVGGILGQPVVIPGNLDRTLSTFSATVRDAVALACDQLGIDRSNIVGSTTLREALRDFGQQFATGGAVVLGGL